MISIILPFYNTEKYINQCLLSIQQQTFLDYEVLLIDDGSTDSSREIAQQYCDVDLRFKLLNNTHIGYPACKNLGLNAAKGDYICFIDSDDYVEKYHLENLYNALISTDSDIASCRYHRIENEYTEIIFTNEYYINEFKVYYENTESILTQYFTNTYPWNKLYKKSLWESLRFDETVEALSDTLLLHRVFERAKRTVYTNYKSYHYRVHENSITHNVRNFSPTYWPFRVNTYIEVCTYICKYSSLVPLAKRIMRSEFKFSRPHLTPEQIAALSINPSLQSLIGKVY